MGVGKLCLTVLAFCLLMGGWVGVSFADLSDDASNARNPDTGTPTPVKTLEEAQARKKAKPEEEPWWTRPKTTAPAKPLSVFTEGSLTYETVDANGNTVNTSESYRDKVLRRRLTYVLNPSSQVLERMNETFTKSGEIRSIRQTRYDVTGAKIFDAQYQFTGNNIASAHLTEWRPERTETSLVFDELGFPLQQTVTYPDGSIKNFDATRSEAGAQKLLEYQFRRSDLSDVRPGASRFVKAGDFGDGTLYPGGFIGLHVVTFQAGENGPTLSYIGGLDPLTGGSVALATRSTTDHLANFYGGEPK